jgi:FAD/FMN-containing dehydrogenase
MATTADPSPDVRRREPWFTQHPGRALAVCVLSIAAIFTLHLMAADADASVLYVLPVALAALASGLRPGTLAGLIASMLMVVGVVVGHEHLSVLAWCSHLAPLLLLGSLAGASADRVRDARRTERYAMSIAMLQRDAAEVNDSVVQGLAATRWLLETGRVEPALEALDETAASAQGLVSRVLGRGGVLGDDIRMPHHVMRIASGE